MFGRFSEESQKIIVLSKEEMKKLMHPYVGTEHLLLSILKNDKELSDRLKKHNLTYKVFRDELINIVGKGSEKVNNYVFTPLYRLILESVTVESKENESIVQVQDLLFTLLNSKEGIAYRVLLSLNIDVDKIKNELKVKVIKKTNKKTLLDSLATDFSKMKFDVVTGRDEEIERLIEVLSRKNKCNPLLIGEAGVGKTAIVEELSRRISLKKVPNSLIDKKIYSLDMATSVAGTKYRGEFEDRIKKIINELENNENIILFIDEVHTLVGAGGAEGAIDASNIFKPALARGTLKIIGATTIKEYKKYIEKDSALDRRFQKIYVDEPDEEKLKDILLNLKTSYEKYHNVIISNEVIDNIINLSKKYIYDRFEPDKSIDILDEVCAKVSLKELKIEKDLISLESSLREIKEKKNKYISLNNLDRAYYYKDKENNLIHRIDNLKNKLSENKKIKTVSINDVKKVISSKSKIPIYEINNDLNKMVKIMEKRLKDNIIGQECAVNSLIDITKKIKLGFKDKCYSLLLCGPTGVGKTYISKIFSESLVGKNNVIKIDMGEYIDSASINKLIGSPAGYIGYDDNKSILEEIRNKPFSVLILDEIEKCNKRVLNFFLNILDEGKCTLANGNVIRFDNVVIIMTSNAFISKKTVGFNNYSLNTLNDYFSKEFLNRIDEVISFDKLSIRDIKRIYNKEVLKYIKKYNLKDSAIKKIEKKVIKDSNYEEYGARKLCKMIRNNIEKEIIGLITLNT